MYTSCITHDRVFLATVTRIQSLNDSATADQKRSTVQYFERSAAAVWQENTATASSSLGIEHVGNTFAHIRAGSVRKRNMIQASAVVCCCYCTCSLKLTFSKTSRILSKYPGTNPSGHTVYRTILF